MKLFGVDYQFMSCGDVFTQGLAHAAGLLGLTYQHAAWDDRPLERATAFRPDLFLVVHGRKFARANRGHAFPCRSAIWLLDEPYEVDNTATFSRDFDYVFLNDPGTLMRHTRATYLPVCADPVIHRAEPEVPRTESVGFIGGANPVRNNVLGALVERGLLTYVIGGPFTPIVQRFARAHNISASMAASWYRRTQIVVNIFRSEHHYNERKIPAVSANPRIYEATACGALVVSEWRPELETICPEMPTFRSMTECCAIVADLVAHPRKTAELQAQCAARLAPHTYAARLQTILTTCGQAVAA